MGQWGQHSIGQLTQVFKQRGSEGPLNTAIFDVISAILNKVLRKKWVFLDRTLLNQLAQHGNSILTFSFLKTIVQRSLMVCY